MIIPEHDIKIKEEITLEDLPLAFSYSKDAIVNQRKRINEIIYESMHGVQVAIELPFRLFPEIAQELKERGWVLNADNWYQPIWTTAPNGQLEIKDESDKISSAQAFYEATLKNQLVVLKQEFDKAREKGLAEIELDFPLYKVILNKLELRGWGTYVYMNYKSAFGTKPYTDICIKIT